jgi:uncharacterized Rmd1/YagE family protein
MAESFNLAAIANHFKRKNYFTKFYRDVLYVTHSANPAELFFLSMGAFVSWGLTSSAEKILADSLKEFMTNPADNIEKDYFTFAYDDKTVLYSHNRFNVDVIELEDSDPQIKLAISYGLSQSVKLESYEESVKQTIKRNSSLSKNLANSGKIFLGSKAISKRIGEIFLERSSVNLSSEYLDMPEYFWQYPRLENYYAMTEKFLDITRRVHSLNQRLDVLHGLLEVLQTQLQHRHSSMLEWVIILLIMLEVVLNIVQWH